MMAESCSFCFLRRSAGFALAAVWLVLAAGCATGPGRNAGAGKDTGPKFVFYPPAPESPRLQFLVSFSDGKDLGGRVSKFSTFITGEEPPQQPILKPYGVVLANNELCVCDTGARAVDILNLVQKTMRRFAPQGAGKLGTPINLTVDTDGTRYITDTGRNQVLVYGADDSFHGVFGENESKRPTGVALTTNRLYVTDLNGHCVRVYAKASRELLFTIPRDPEAEEAKEPGKLFMPVALALDQQGRLYVTDIAACRIQIYDAEGRQLRSLGARGDLPGQFARPKGIAVDREGRIYVVDAATQVCQIFDPEGKLLLFFGEPEGSAAPLNLPAAVTVDYEHVGLFKQYVAPDFVVEHLVIITNQLGDRKVSVYGLGHKQGPRQP
jgi:sugar lactone lactonase YvrE